jgi:hypothetical protein
LPIFTLFALMETPGAMSTLDVTLDAFDVSTVAAPVPVVDDEPLPAADVPADAPALVPVPVSVPVFEPSLVSDPPPGDVEPGVVESALATPGVVATISPMPKAAANAPTRPMWRLYVLTRIVGVVVCLVE